MLDIADESTSQNVEISDGNLIFTASGVLGCPKGRTYTSGRVQSRGKGDFTYGKFEARIKLPTGQGSWPASLDASNAQKWFVRGIMERGPRRVRLILWRR